MPAKEYNILTPGEVCSLMTARCPPRRLGCWSRSPSAPDCGGRADRAAGVGPAHAVGHGDGDEGGHGGQRGVPSRGVAGSWSSPTRRTSARGASNSTRISCSRSRTTSPGTGLHPRTCCSGRHIPRAGRIASTPSVDGGPRSDRAERSRAALPHGPMSAYTQPEDAGASTAEQPSRLTAPSVEKPATPCRRCPETSQL